MWWKQTQIRMHKPVRSKWTIHKFHGCFCILLAIQRKFKFWTDNSNLVQSQKGTEAILEKKTKINSCSLVSYLSLPYMYTFRNHLLNNYCYWPDYEVDFCKKILGDRELTIVFKSYIVFLKILGVIYVSVSPKHYLMRTYKCVGI